MEIVASICYKTSVNAIAVVNWKAVKNLVLQDLAPDSNLTCITEHPGFQPVCLQKWSLRLAADKFMRINMISVIRIYYCTCKQL